MNITEEMVREVQKKVDVSYEEVEYTLKKTRGDVNMAIYLIMKRNNSGWERFKASLHDIFKQLLRYRLILTRKGKTLIDLPLILLVTLVLIDGVYRHFFPLFVIFVLALVFECEAKIEKSEVEGKSAPEKGRTTQTNTEPVETTINTASSQPDRANPSAKSQPTIVVESVETCSKKNENENEDDYFEIVIEE